MTGQRSQLSDFLGMVYQNATPKPLEMEQLVDSLSQESYPLFNLLRGYLTLEAQRQANLIIASTGAPEDQVEYARGYFAACATLLHYMNKAEIAKETKHGTGK